MPEILLIDAEQPFAGDLSSSLTEKGFSVTQVEDGKAALEKARGSAPDLIVLCVELPKMSGYSVCNKLKKDDALKKIPLIITSKEATPETFEQHKKLKTRAEEYLLKPFAADDLMGKMGSHIDLPDGAGNGEAEGDDAFDALDALGGDEEISLDEDLDLDDGLELLEDDASLESGPPEAPPPTGEEEIPDLDDEMLALDNLDLPADEGEEADEAPESLDDLDSFDAAFEELAPTPEEEERGPRRVRRSAR
jgi:CheY-like chemotaxis protein